MSDGKRPGGLTALAVLNFVFGGLGALGLLAIFAMLNVAESVTTASGDVEARETVRASLGPVWIHLFLALATVALMITSGVGYLGQKRFLGRTLGNAYAVCSLASTGIGLTHSAFGIGTLIGIIYPVLTLMLINTTFKEDLVN